MRSPRWESPAGFHHPHRRARDRAGELSSPAHASGELDLPTCELEHSMPGKLRRRPQASSTAPRHASFIDARRRARPRLLLQSFELEKLSGKKCFRISARGLKIAWGDTARYWKWKSESNSRFPEVAELMSVCWLEIQCSVNARALSPKTTYCAYLIFNMAQGSYGLTFPPQESIIKLGSHVSKQNVCLEPDESDPPQPRLTLLGRSASFRVPPRDSGTYGPVKSPCRRDDGWMEVEMGRFFVDEGEEENVDVSMMEVEGGQWKRGLVIQGIELRPMR